MLIEIDFNSDEAIYIQLRNQIIMGIATSTIHEGDTLPSVRQLADNIGINMHTVNKAYNVLRQEGFLQLDRRRGAVICIDEDKLEALQDLKEQLRVLLAKGSCKNITKEEVHELVDEIYAGHSLPGGIVLAVMFGVPLLLIALKEPLTNKIKKKTEKMEQSKAMFVTQAFFELFETLLSYFSNTLSFIRIGAFAVSHASIMEVVLMLAGAESGHINWVVIVLGNLFVCGFEGLIVGIQVLRLVYYEMFSRFYKGSGREFKPYTGTAKN